MTSSRLLRFLAAASVLLVFTLAPLCAEMVTDSDYGWSLDLPEGFAVADQTEDGMSYLFQHDRMPVFLAVKLHEKGTYDAAEKAVTDTVAKLPSGACTGTSSFTWRNQDCAICTFTMSLDDAKKGNTPYQGWAVSAQLPLTAANIVLLCYADQKIENDCEQFIMSVLNSLAVDRGSYFEPGIIASYAYPQTERKNITLEINGHNIQTQLGKDDVEASEFAVNCEYAVLTLYANNDKWQEAWQRYYRAVFRDSYGRLRQASFDIHNALSQDAQQLNPQAPDEGMAQLLLAWTQGFSYAREKNQAAFTSLPAALTGTGSDCDSRSLLLCALLENMGTKTALFVSREYSHAVFGADVQEADKSQNARMAAGGASFLLGETTAKGVKMGQIARDMSDPKKWIPVELQ